MVLILWAFDKCPLKEVIAKKGLNPGACSRLLSRAVEHLDGKICQLHLISFRPDKPKRFSGLAEGMRIRNVPAEKATHFLMKLMFCMFAEDIELLPGKLFTKLLTACKDHPDRLTDRLSELFQAMCKGGYFGVDAILHFNGGLFADADVVPLLPPEIVQLIRANDRDWSNVEPSIFGTLFERT